MNREADAMRVLYAHETVERIGLRHRLVGDDDETEMSTAARERTLRGQCDLCAAPGWDTDIVADLGSGSVRVSRFVELDRGREQVRTWVEQRHLAGEAHGCAATGNTTVGAPWSAPANTQPANQAKQQERVRASILQ